jgi:beta-lactamase regulating signal transducer with metallopeptidase domain
MNPTLLSSPAGEFVLRLTILLCVAWLAQAGFAAQHARWRLLLWRSVLVLGLLIPLARVEFWGRLMIPVEAPEVARLFRSEGLETGTTAEARESASGGISASSPGATSTAASTLADAGETAGAFPWAGFLVGVWALGFGWRAVRLIGLHLRLGALVRGASEPTPELLAKARTVQARLGLGGPVCLRVSDAAVSPFVCGGWRPVLVLPARLLAEIGEAELDVLLGHEMAHLRSRDLVWCIAWRWAHAALWFHPLVWQAPAAHQLACEQEADRIAADQVEGPDNYAPVLARLVLRIHRQPTLETVLTLNAGSQIARRLQHLKRFGAGPWRWAHSAVALTLGGALALIAIGWSIAGSREAVDRDPVYGRAPKTYREAVVLVQDAEGRAVEGAKLQATAFRVKGPGQGSHYGWRDAVFGAPPVLTTDKAGRAKVRYPVDVIPEEDLEMGKVTFFVTHPDFVPVHLDFAVDKGASAPLKLTTGVRVEVSGYFGPERQEVLELVPRMSPGRYESGQVEWKALANGRRASRQIAPGTHLLQLMGRLPSGEIVHSDSVEIEIAPGKEASFSLELKPGHRLEGRLDASVPRPVKNGGVVVSVRPSQVPYPRDFHVQQQVSAKYGYLIFWGTYRAVAEDGTFVVESLPPGDVEIIAWGEGFVSRTGDVSLNDEQMFVLPQNFPLEGPSTSIEVATEPTATLIVNAKTKGGKAAEGVLFLISPNMYMSFGADILGHTDVRNSDEQPFYQPPELPRPNYSAVTDKEGKARIPNLPGKRLSIFCSSPEFRLPLKAANGWSEPSRDERVDLAAGQTSEVEVVLETK